MRRMTRVWVFVATGGVALMLAVMPVAGPAAASPIVGFAARFTANDNGTISIFGNNLLTCPTADPRCAGARAGTARLNNNSFAMVNLDVDGPDGSEVLWAGLYWGARVSGGTGGTAGSSVVATRRTMSFRPAGSPAY